MGTRDVPRTDLGSYMLYAASRYIPPPLRAQSSSIDYEQRAISVRFEPETSTPGGSHLTVSATNVEERE